MVNRLVMPMSLLSLLMSGAIFGFFYAWVCSTMWGLDTLAPNAAIAAMNAMNISVRNAVFFPAFFGTPVILFAAAVLTHLSNHRKTAAFFAVGAAIYVFGAFLPTANINVPMNIALEVYAEPLPKAEAQAIWNDYSARWQFWNIARSIASGVTLLMVGFGLHALKPNA